MKKLLLALLLLTSAGAAAQVSACYTCPLQRGTGGVCTVTVGGNGSCTCANKGVAPYQYCSTTGTCVIGQESCGSVGDGGGAESVRETSATGAPAHAVDTAVLMSSDKR